MLIVFFALNKDRSYLIVCIPISLIFFMQPQTVHIIICKFVRVEQFQDKVFVLEKQCIYPPFLLPIHSIYWSKDLVLSYILSIIGLRLEDVIPSLFPVEFWASHHYWSILSLQVPVGVVVEPNPGAAQKRKIMQKWQHSFSKFTLVAEN